MLSAIPSWLETLGDYALVVGAVGAAAVVLAKAYRSIDTKVDRVLYELNDNKGGSFKDWVRLEFGDIKTFMEASAADRAGLHHKSDVLDKKFEDEIARTKLAEHGDVDDRDPDEETPHE